MTSLVRRSRSPILMRTKILKVGTRPRRKEVLQEISVCASGQPKVSVQNSNSMKRLGLFLLLSHLCRQLSARRIVARFKEQLLL